MMLRYFCMGFFFGIFCLKAYMFEKLVLQMWGAACGQQYFVCATAASASLLSSPPSPCSFNIICFMSSDNC